MLTATLSTVIAYAAGTTSTLLFVRGFNVCGSIVGLLAAATCSALLFLT